MSYHLFIQSSFSLEALEFARAKIQTGEKIAQVYFYEEGVHQAVRFAKEWQALISQLEVLKLCQTYAENYQVVTPAGFVVRGLVDFFAQHWQDQGELIQFK